MSIHLNQPYKITPSKYKRYEAHYRIPAADVVVIPMKQFGDEVSCDIRWEDHHGELQVIHHVMFITENLVPLNPMLDVKQHELWSHYYKPLSTNNE